MPNCTIGIDIGTTGVKTIALDQNGQILVEAHYEHDLHCKQPGWAEEDPQDWWKGTVITLKEILSQIDSKQVLGIGVSGMVPALVLLDRSGNPLRLSIQQNDARTEKQILWLKERIDTQEYFKVTGCTLNQQVIAPKLLWIKEHEPDIYRAVRWVLGSYDYINYRLTGNLSLEQNWALESGLWAAQERKWYEPIFNLLNIPESWFPPVRLPTDIIGKTYKCIEKDIGLSSGIAVIAGSADHIASVLGSGGTSPGDLIIKLGGAGDVLYCLDSFSPDPRFYIDHHNLPGKYCISGCMASSGSVVKWFKNLINGKKNSYANLDKQAKKITCGSGGLIVLPYFLGEKTPIFDPSARGVIFGLTLHHNKYHIYRAILESVAYGFNHHVKLIEEMGYPINRVIVTDQGATSTVWRQICSDVLGQSLFYANRNFGSAYGTAFLAGVAMETWEWDEIEKFTNLCLANRPREENHKLYNKLFRLYLRIYEHIKMDFKDIRQDNHGEL